MSRLSFCPTLQTRHLACLWFRKCSHVSSITLAVHFMLSSISNQFTYTSFSRLILLFLILLMTINQRANRMASVPDWKEPGCLRFTLCCELVSLRPASSCVLFHWLHPQEAGFIASCCRLVLNESSCAGWSGQEKQEGSVVVRERFYCTYPPNILLSQFAAFHFVLEWNRNSCMMCEQPESLNRSTPRLLVLKLYCSYWKKL